MPDIKQYILNKCTPAKVPEDNLRLEFQTDIFQDANEIESFKNLPYPFQRSELLPLPIVNSVVRVPGDLGAKKVVELILDGSSWGTTVDWNDIWPGDTIAILPYNNGADVEKLLSRLGYDEGKADLKCSVALSTNARKTAKIPGHIPVITTPRQILKHCLDLRGILKKQFLSRLAECCTNIEEQAFLRSLSSKEGSTSYNELIIEEGLRLGDILLKHCPSCLPPLEILIEHLPRLLPRPYSVANYPKQKELKVIFSILSEKPGLTTSLLSNLSDEVLDKNLPGLQPSVWAYLRQENRFRFTSEEAEESNQILIGVGTGIAPYLGFLELKSQLIRDKPLGSTWLFVGARRSSFVLYRTQLLQYAQTGVLDRYYEGFSRESRAKAKYVQDNILHNAQNFTEFLLKANTNLYVCADGSQISKSIEAAIRECLKLTLGIDETEAGEMLKEFRKSGKYREDVWT